MSINFSTWTNSMTRNWICIMCIVAPFVVIIIVLSQIHVLGFLLMAIYMLIDNALKIYSIWINPNLQLAFGMWLTIEEILWSLQAKVYDSNSCSNNNYLSLLILFFPIHLLHIHDTIMKSTVTNRIYYTWHAFMSVLNSHNWKHHKT